MYSFTSKVRYSEVDARGRLNEAGVINYFQDCSNFQSEALGVGVEYLMSIKHVWVLSSWHVIYEKEIKAGDEITIATWPTSFRGLIGTRNFVIYDAAGEVCAKADTIWAYIDITTGRPAKITEDVASRYTLEPALDMPKADRKIKMPQQMEAMTAFPVCKSHLDTNNHVNNGKYITMALEYLPEAFKTYELRAEYKKSAVYGDIIYPRVRLEDDTFYVALCDGEGNVYAGVAFRKIDKL